MGGHDPYSSSKGAAELVTSAYRRSFFSSPDATRVASARAGNVIGGGDWGADRLIPDVMRAALAGEARRDPQSRARRARGSTCSIRSAATWSWPSGCGTTRRRRPPGTSDPRRRTLGRSAGSSNELAALWPGELGLGARRRRAPARGALPQGRLVAGARAARLGPALGPRARARRDRRVVRRPARRRRHARGHAAPARASSAARTAARLPAMSTPCRFCSAPLEAVFADLGHVAAGQLVPHAASRPTGWSRSIRCARCVCARCFLVQLEEYESPSHIFSEYAYFSSYSSSWLEHSERYAAAMIERFGLGAAEPRRRGRVERRLPAAVLQGARRAGTGDRAGGQRRQGRGAEGPADARRVLRRRDGAQPGCPSPAPTY